MYRKVKKIIDGDTFTTTYNETIRIANFNTPERNRSGFIQATRDLESIIPVGSPVNLVTKATDKWGRKIANVYKKGRNVANLMRNKGW